MLRCILADWEYEQSKGWSEREVRNLKKLLPVSANKVKATILRRKEEGFIIMVGDKILYEMLITISNWSPNIYIHILKVNGVDKITLCGKTTDNAGDLGFGQVKRILLMLLVIYFYGSGGEDGAGTTKAGSCPA